MKRTKTFSTRPAAVMHRAAGIVQLLCRMRALGVPPDTLRSIALIGLKEDPLAYREALRAVIEAEREQK